jgi:CDGSH-type Zn-finger protein/uncharacterized Fe-S cluster protein YjdI
MNQPAKVYRYQSDEAEIAWDSGRCLHAAECVRRAPVAFDPRAKPWIRPEKEPVQALAEAVNRCPSGALSMQYADGTSALVTPSLNTCLVNANGPNYFRGRLVLKQGDALLDETRLALCRCGASQRKPYCDNSHQKTGFAHDGMLPVSKEPPQGADLSASLTITPTLNGPLQCTGPLTLRGAAGHAKFEEATYLCRCGGSQNKPYCDGTHRKIGFTG